jgi:hypothetical protein
VLCWGGNDQGQLGDGSNSKRDTATPVGYLRANTASLAAGDNHTCATGTDGTAYCWGANDLGQLGDGTSTDRLYYAQVQGLGGTVVAIEGGYQHTCALLVDSSIQCWGYNQYGQLGNGTTLNRLLPTYVLTSQTCFKVTPASTGSGALPALSPAQSVGCPEGHFLPGQTLFLLAAPNADQRVKSWTNVTAGAPGDNIAHLAMTAADRTVTVAYEACSVLSASHLGLGSDPAIVTPSESNGCAAALFAAGEPIAVRASPAPGWVVARWEGTQNDASTQTVNTVLMPGGAASVRVVYREVARSNYLPVVQR